MNYTEIDSQPIPKINHENGTPNYLLSEDDVIGIVELVSSLSSLEDGQLNLLVLQKIRNKMLTNGESEAIIKQDAARRMREV